MTRSPLDAPAETAQKVLRLGDAVTFAGTELPPGLHTLTGGGLGDLARVVVQADLDGSEDQREHDDGQNRELHASESAVAPQPARGCAPSPTGYCRAAS